MPKTVIDIDLLRKKSEHNEGVLGSLEEISLHQLEIEKIETLDKYCKNLKILYLQNNLIAKIENLGKLKSLEYLNLAINNIWKIEGLKFCESLYKLDLTLNFIELKDFESSLKELSYCEQLWELYLTGNPSCDWPWYKEYVMAKLKSIAWIDGDDVTKSMQIKAKQDLPEL